MARMLIVLALLGLSLATWASKTSEDGGRLMKRFDELIVPQVESAVANPVSNDQGGIAWGTSYQLDALAQMLDVTRDRRYADLFVKLGRSVADRRDTKLGLRDEIRDKVLPAWGSTKYSSGKHYVWAVHTGMIVAPMAHFAAVVRSDPELSRQYSKAADYFVRVAEDALAVHDDQWRDGPGEKEGYIYGLWMKKNLPLNQQNAPGRAYLCLYDATGNAKYREKAERLAYFLKSHLRLTDDGAYIWDYWAPLNGPGAGLEDISHAAINADFIVLCREHGIVFTKDDISRLEKTLTTKVILSDAEVANNVGGTGGTNTYARQVFRWGGLARYSESARRALMTLCCSEKFSAVSGGPDSLGTAYLVTAAYQ